MNLGCFFYTLKKFKIYNYNLWVIFHFRNAMWKAAGIYLYHNKREMFPKGVVLIDYCYAYEQGVIPVL